MYKLDTIHNINININNFKNRIITRYPQIYDIPKLMIFNKKNKEIIHDKIINLDKYFNKNDLIIINDSKAYPIKYKAYKIKNNIKSYIDIYLKKEINSKENIWDVLVNPARKVRIGNKLFFKINKNDIITSEVLNNTTSKGRILKFLYERNNFLFKKKFFPSGKFLLHTFTKKHYDISNKYYENSYSKKIGSIIFPTSGAYIDKNILLKLKLKNVNIFKITYHLSYNQLNKTYNKKFKKKPFNNEKLIILNKELKKIKNKKFNNICCIGINTLKAIENLISIKYNIIEYNGYLNNNIDYLYKYKKINSLLTYFNNPNTNNFMVLYNLCGKYINYIYNEAINNNYKFNIYGDLLLVI
ncbi:MAG: S-adenosylmethionine:tRNA ribosyltransferase-isomerase [Candidatus Shikimatogenerans bostrichidophilus]|nr:MAG: S-adenosylmethionine:tRNA ribosyltransferase-isomerase [Candidatus Shikimatogenerans bostrichidophilus]